MNKTNIINNLQTIADCLNALAQELRSNEAATELKVNIKEEVVTEEMVREKLYALTKGGKLKEVKTLLKKFGADKITEVSAENYSELLKGAELLN